MSQTSLKNENFMNMDTSSETSSVPSRSNVDTRTELYRYKVIYPGGTFVRVSPDINAEKAGEVIDFGTVIETQKSIVLDGINYIRTSHNGWIFESKNGVQVLELLECVRFPQKEIEMCAGTIRDVQMTVSRARSKRNKLLTMSGEDRRYWRQARARCSELTTFDNFVQFASCLEKQPPAEPDPGPARAAWIARASEEEDQKIRHCISRIAAITRQSVDDVSVSGLEACLWLMVHLGGKIAKVLDLAVQAANDKYDKILIDFRPKILVMALDVGARARPVAVELARLPGVDMLPDDMKNFLQRWVIIKSLRRTDGPLSHSRSEAVAVRGSDASRGDASDRSFSSETARAVRTPVALQPRSQWTSPFASCMQRVPEKSDGRARRGTAKCDEVESPVASKTPLWDGVQREIRSLSDTAVQLAKLF